MGIELDNAVAYELGDWQKHIRNGIIARREEQIRAINRQNALGLRKVAKSTSSKTVPRLFFLKIVRGGFCLLTLKIFQTSSLPIIQVKASIMQREKINERRVAHRHFFGWLPVAAYARPNGFSPLRELYHT